MTLNNEEERRAWVAFAAACMTQETVECACNLSDKLLEEYRDRLPATPAADGPDWSTAPQWAEWWAMDEDKEKFWYKGEIEQGNRYWVRRDWGLFKQCFGPYVYPGDFRDSKIRRPK